MSKDLFDKELHNMDIRKKRLQDRQDEVLFEYHNNLLSLIDAKRHDGVKATELYKVVSDFNAVSHPVSEKFTHSTLLEVVWTILPAIILMIIAVPSFGLLYSLDELIDPTITLKIVGHQWYWSYEYSDYATLEGGESLNFDSYLVTTADLNRGAFRLLEVDNRVLLPINTHIRLLITAADVLHCWAVPSFGIKVDACPGRLSQASLFIKREGYFYGQCSEICGVNHGFMPIVVRGVYVDKFIKWISSKLDNLILN